MLVVVIWHDIITCDDRVMRSVADFHALPYAKGTNETYIYI
jgi:hypothetical protein